MLPYHTGLWVSGYVDNTNRRLWFPTNTSTGTGFGCLDISNIASPAWCGGSSAVGTGFIKNPDVAGYSGYGAADRIVNVGTKIYSLDLSGKLICLDTATSANCSTPSVDTGAARGSNGTPVYLLAVGNKIFGAAGTDSTSKGFCIDTDTNLKCTGAGWPLTLAGGYHVAYQQPNAAGTVEGICFKKIVTTASTASTCYKTDGSETAGTTVTANTGLAETMVAAPTLERAFPLPLTVGARVYTGNGEYDATGAFGCYDVATSAKCAGSWPINAGIYAIVADPTTPGCVWTNNNLGEIKSYLADGTLGCFTGSAATAFAPTLPCTGGVISSWQSFALSAPVATGYSAATLTVTDLAGAVVTSGGKTWSAVPITGAKRTVDLSGLAVKDTGVAPTFTVSYTGLTAKGDATAAIVMGVKKAVGCTRTVPAPPSPFSASTTGGTGKKKSATIRTTVGGRITLTLRSTNSGTTTSKGTKFTCVVPRAFRIVSAKGGKIKGQTVTWTIGDLKSKKTAMRSLVLRAVGRGSHGVDFSVTSKNLIGTTATAATILVRGSAAPAVTG